MGGKFPGRGNFNFPGGNPRENTWMLRAACTFGELVCVYRSALLMPQVNGLKQIRLDEMGAASATGVIRKIDKQYNVSTLMIRELTDLWPQIKDVWMNGMNRYILSNVNISFIPFLVLTLKFSLQLFEFLPTSVYSRLSWQLYYNCKLAELCYPENNCQIVIRC